VLPNACHYLTNLLKLWEYLKEYSAIDLLISSNGPNEIRSYM